jgi:hypothetical protein
MIDWNDNTMRAIHKFYEYLDEQGMYYANKEGCIREFFDWLPQTKTVADTPPYPHFKVTRENLEKIAKDAHGDFVEVEQEGEKWTHEYDSANIKCRILATDGDECWVLTEYGNKVTESICSIKPIKPTISAKEYDMLAKYASHYSVDPKEFGQYMIDNYERQLKD